MNQIEVRSAGLSDTGLVRNENQDHYFVAELTRSLAVQSGSIGADQDSRLFGGPFGYLFFVADGMGGHRAGNEASRLAIEYFVNAVLNSARWIANVEQFSQSSFVNDLKKMLLDAHRMIEQRSVGHAELKGMGTTLTVAYVAWPKMFIVHAGDTRCYILRDGSLQLITNDHTVANQMMRAGQLAPDALERSPWSNVLVNALGAGAEDVFAEVHELDLMPDDAILLCSDGLNKHVNDDRIRAVVTSPTDPASMCQTLINLAKEDGGSDNITAIVAQFIRSTSWDNRFNCIRAAQLRDERVLGEINILNELDTTSESRTQSFAGGNEPLVDRDTRDFPEATDESPFAPHSM